MPNSRRHFLALLAATTACRKPPPPGAPPAFGTSPDAGPPISPATFAEAEKLVQFSLTPSDRNLAATNWRKTMAPLYERRTGPRKFSPSLAPATRWDPGQPLRAQDYN